jgi:hypothetical protein
LANLSGRNPSYERKLAWENVILLNSTNDRGPIPVSLRHDQRGPVLRAYCCKFVPAPDEDICLHYKRDQKWEELQSTPFVLTKHDGLDGYIVKYMHFYLQQVENGGSWIDQIFAEAKKHLDVITAFSSHFE